MLQALVLSIGSDVRVLNTRELILRSAGHAVVSAISIREAAVLLKDSDFDVIVLCHTLLKKDCERFTGHLRASGSHIPILYVSSTPSDEPSDFADATLDKNPDAFLMALQEVLRNHAHRELLDRET